MPNDLLLILYIANSVFLLTHEIDSGYWQEWKLFRLRGGINTFLLLHIPMILLILIGLLETQKGTNAGYLFSAIVSMAGIFAFFIHAYFRRKGNEEFGTAMSKFILWMVLIISAMQLALTVYLY